MELFHVRDDALRSTPAGGKEPFWYGFRNLKREFDSILKRSLTARQRITVLNRGPIGSGKTHAAQYYSNPTIVGKLKGATYSAVYPVVVASPKQGAGAFKDTYTRIVEMLTFSRIVAAVALCKKRSSQPDLCRSLVDVTGNEDISSVISRLSDADLLASRMYLLGSGGIRDLRSLGVGRKLSSEHDFVAALTGVFHVLASGTKGAKGKRNRIVLWVDEMEDLVFFRTRDYLPFTQAMRDLIDRNSDDFTLFLNFTFSEPGEIASIEEVLGSALMSRIDEHVVFGESTETDTTSYLKDLLANNWTGSGQYSEPYPFDNRAFELLVGACVTHTPRYVNKLLKAMLEKLADDPSLKETRKPTITAAHVDKVLPTISQQIEQE